VGAVQERDALGDESVPDYFTHIEQGKFLWMAVRVWRVRSEDPRR